MTEKYGDLKKQFEEKCEQYQKDYEELKADFMNSELEWKNKLREEVERKEREI